MILPKTEYGFEAPLTVLQFSTPFRQQQYADLGHGGYDETASGLPEMFEIRRDYARALSLSFKDSEYLVVEDWFHWAQTAGPTPWNFWFDGSDALTMYSVFLQSPKIGSPFRPERDTFNGLWWLPIEIRTSDGSKITYNHSGF